MHYWVKACPFDFSRTLPKPRRHPSLSLSTNSLRFFFTIIFMDYSCGVSVATPLSSCLVASSKVISPFYEIELYCSTTFFIAICRDRLGRRFDVKDVAHVKFDRKTKNGTLSLFPLSKALAAHKSVLVGDLKMANFKQFLANKGIQVEFPRGALRCGEYFTLRKVTNASQNVRTSVRWLELVAEQAACSGKMLSPDQVNPNKDLFGITLSVLKQIN
uniref:Cleavage and polyadenylation specificity factor 2 C-terminal domain-containing protein n=1 Tax=Cucumis melo TaxID=3656 RepID=A0A9I9EJV5_CUCME